MSSLQLLLPLVLLSLQLWHLCQLLNLLHTPRMEDLGMLLLRLVLLWR